MIESLRDSKLPRRCWKQSPVYYLAKAHALLPFCNNIGDFEYQDFRQIKFPEWQTYAESPDYLASDEEDDDYLINRVARLFCRAIDHLVEQRSFERLRLSQPFLIRFAFHDHDQHVLHMLNLPGMA